MALERHNPADEFDPMFRRHLKRGGAPVAPCLGFDADTASAYLERALDTFIQARFETHLAGCAACRRQVVELARLQSEIESLSAKPPVVVAAPVWSRWYGAVAQWFDFSGWNRDWTVAATACSLLLAVLTASMWQRLNARHDAAAMMAANTAAGAQAAASTDELRINMSAAPAAPELVAKLEGDQTALTNAPQAQADLFTPGNDKQLERQIAVPAPVTRQPALTSFDNSLIATVPQPGVKAFALEINETNFGTQPAPPPPPGLTAAPAGFSPNNRSLALPIGFGSRQAMREPSHISLQPSEIEKKEIVSGLVLPELRRASDETAKPAANEQTASDPAAAARSRELRNALNKGHAFGLMPLKNDDARTKEADVKQAREQLKPLMQRLNGHTFYFDHGCWIDEEYKSDTTLPIVPLTRGSERYQKVLIENPTLEQFFHLGPVIVVWKGKVYEVRK